MLQRANSVSHCAHLYEVPTHMECSPDHGFWVCCSRPVPQRSQHCWEHDSQCGATTGTQTTTNSRVQTDTYMYNRWQMFQRLATENHKCTHSSSIHKQYTTYNKGIKRVLCEHDSLSPLPQIDAESQFLYCRAVS